MSAKRVFVAILTALAMVAAGVLAVVVLRGGSGGGIVGTRPEPSTSGPSAVSPFTGLAGGYGPYSP